MKHALGWLLETWSLSHAKKIIASTTQDRLLTTNRKSEHNKSTPLFLEFSTTYSPQFKSITGINKKYIPILTIDNKLKDNLSTPVQYVA